MLCYVTDGRGLTGDPAAVNSILLRKIEQAAKAGVDWIQLREKSLTGRELADLAESAKQRLAGSSKLIINDRLDVAVAAGAAGVHLGERSLPIKEARRFLAERCPGREFWIGASTHSVEAAWEAEASGADYVIFGPVFATPSKAGFGEPQGTAKLREVCELVNIPVLAIGGIALENAGEVLQAGASGIAAIRLFQETADLRSLVAQLQPPA